MHIKICNTLKQIMSTFPIMKDLHPHLEEGKYFNIIQDMQEKGYHLVGAFVEDECIGAAGYRFLNMLVLSGQKHLYVDDLVVKQEMRSKSVGKQLILWLEHAARQAGCVEIVLDSSHHRTGAHRFYERERFLSTAQHFRKAL